MIPRLQQLLEKKRRRAAASDTPENLRDRAPAAKAGGRAHTTLEDESPVVQKLLKKARKKAEKGGVRFHDVDRICALRVQPTLTEAQVEDYNKKHVLVEAYREGFRFNHAQVSCFTGYQEESGGFYSVGVGKGKTAIGLYIASLAYNKGHRKILLLVPSQVYPQLMKYDLAWARKRFTLGLPVIALGNTSSARRRLAVKNKKRGLFVLPYSLLSVKDTEYMLEHVDADCVIADEAHKLKNPHAARTKRLVKFLDAKQPEFVAMSGTITDKSIKDYAHLIRFALGDGSPLPLEGHTANDWAVVLDSTSAGRSGEEATGPLMPLVYWGRKHFPDTAFAPSQAGFRKAYKHRLVTTPGVVSTPDSGVKCSLVFTNEATCVPSEYEGEGGQELHDLIEQVNEEWLTPTGDEIEHAIHTFKWLYELTSGFYNNLFWPDARVVAKRKSISWGEAEDQLNRSRLQHAAKQEYHKSLRSFLQDEQLPLLDTPFLVGSHFYRVSKGRLPLNREIPRECYDLWTTMKGMEWEGMPERDSEVVRVCDYKIVHLVAWLNSLPKKTQAMGGIIWVHHQGIGRWVFERLREAGFSTLHCPAGPTHNETILSSRGEWCVASIKAHGTGKNLQHHENQYYFQWPRQATTAEQSLGRLHRQGQKADVLNVVTNLTTEFDRLCLAACLNDALYVHQTTGSPQKLIYGTYNPVPQVFPAAVLQERGFRNKLLTKQQEQLLAEKFGMVLEL